MELQNVVPWGRSLSEYQKMFSLSGEDLQKKILGVGDGPAGFNAELTQRGGRVVSVDPVYRFSREQIRTRIGEVYPEVMGEVEKNAGDYVWETLSGPEELGQVRMAAMDQFLNDYDRGKREGRYLCASLPSLPFGNKEFELALCSHYLFLYSGHVSLEEHIESMKELCRVASEVRVYPLVSLDGVMSGHITPAMAALSENGIEVTLREVDYQFQKGAVEMLLAGYK